jgi:hypothetical protein
MSTEVEEKIAAFQSLLIEGWSVGSARGRAGISQSYEARFLRNEPRYEYLLKKFRRSVPRTYTTAKPKVRNESLHLFLSPPDAPDLLPGVVQCLE